MPSLLPWKFSFIVYDPVPESLCSQALLGHALGEQSACSFLLAHTVYSDSTVPTKSYYLPSYPFDSKSKGWLFLSFGSSETENYMQDLIRTQYFCTFKINSIAYRMAGKREKNLCNILLYLEYKPSRIKFLYSHLHVRIHCYFKRRTRKNTRGHSFCLSHIYVCTCVLGWNVK